MPAPTLLQRMQELRRKFHGVSCEQTARDLFDELEEHRRYFEDTLGLLKTDSDYIQAAEIHRGLLEETFRWNAAWRQEILTPHAFYT